MTQGSIFEPAKRESAVAGLTITRQQKQILSKQQQTFNRLVKKIESLRIELEQVKNTLDEKLNFYSKHIYPLEQQMTALRKEIVKQLYRFFIDKKMLAKKARQYLKAVLRTQLELIFSFEKSEPDDELKKIFKAVEGKSFEEAAEEDLDNMKYEMETMFEEFGFDMDFDDLRNDMTPEEVMLKVKEMEEQIRQQSEAREQENATRKKTKKQLEKEERERQVEEARTKNISSIYKQLAKVFHPDLEQDEELKLQKEELMKQLTAAYENNDLHTLLNLELAWIQKEENNPAKLTDDKLGIYNEVLKEQVYELEDEISMAFNHARYQPLQNFAMFAGQLKNLDFKKTMRQMDAQANDMAQTLTRLKGNEKQALAEVKDLIEVYENDLRSNIDFARFFN